MTADSDRRTQAPRPRAPVTRVVKLTRFKDLAGRTLSYATDDLPTGRSRRCGKTWLDLAHVPEFEGEEAWFVVERVQAVPWAYWRAVRRVEGEINADLVRAT